MKELLRNRVIKKGLYIAVPLLVVLLLLIIFSSDGSREVEDDTLSNPVTFTKSRGSRDTTTASSPTTVSYDDDVEEDVVSSEGELEVLKLQPHLPIAIDSFETSSGITTSILIHTALSDPSNAIRIEITGIDYLSRDSVSQSSAYAESFTEARKEIEKYGADIHNIDLILGSRPVIDETANHWVKIYSLL